MGVYLARPLPAAPWRLIALLASSSFCLLPLAAARPDYNNETGVITCDYPTRANCVMPFKSTNTTLLHFFGGERNRVLNFRIGMRENRTEIPFIWLRDDMRCSEIDEWAVRPHNISFSSRCEGTPLTRYSEVEAVWDSSADALMDQELLDLLFKDGDDSWGEWSAREVAMNCSELMNTRVGEGNYTLHLYVDGSPSTPCGNAFLFPHWGKYDYVFLWDQPLNTVPDWVINRCPPQPCTFSTTTMTTTTTSETTTETTEPDPTSTPESTTTTPSTTTTDVVTTPTTTTTTSTPSTTTTTTITSTSTRTSSTSTTTTTTARATSTETPSTSTVTKQTTTETSSPTGSSTGTGTSSSSTSSTETTTSGSGASRRCASTTGVLGLHSWVVRLAGGLAQHPNALFMGHCLLLAAILIRP